MNSLKSSRLRKHSMLASLLAIAIAIAGCGSSGSTSPSTSVTENSLANAPGGTASASPSSYVSAAPAVNAQDNFVTLQETEGASTVDYPVQLGRTFLAGEIPNYPQALIDGLGVETQANVKTRWPDGSVKHAILSFYIPRLGAKESKRITFTNQLDGQQSGLSDAQLLDPRFNFDSVLSISNGSASASVSAREMLTNGYVRRWLEGSISTSVILADHSTSRTFDLGFDVHRSLRPVFHATFWPRINKVFVRVIGETSNPDAWQTITYDLNVTGGMNQPVAIYSKPSVSHHPAARWTRTFWIGPPPGKVRIDHNVKYLAASGAVPNFNSTVQVSEQTVQSWHSRWTSTAKGVFDAGNWTKYMGTGGGRPDIGIYPTWTVLWLFTGDPRLEEVARGNADLAGAWPMHFRESRSDRDFFPSTPGNAQGKVFSSFARPTFMLSQYNVNIRHAEIKPEDRINFVGSEGNYNGWLGDGAHQPDPFSALYMLTGEYWYLEQLQFWASWGAFHGVAAPSLYYSRGPLYSSGGIAGEDRAQAWVFRTRAHAAWLSPDGSPERAYFERLLKDAIAIWEGRQNVRGTEFSSSQEWAWGNWASEGTRAQFGESPLGFWSAGLDGYATESYFLSGIVSKGLATWQNSFVVVALGRARELGYPTAPLLEWAAPFFNAIGANVVDNFAYLGAYTVPSVLISPGRIVQSWGEALSGFRPDFDPVARFRVTLSDLDHGYGNIACAASTYVARYQGGAAPQAFCAQEQQAYANFSTNPKWAILPR